VSTTKIEKPGLWPSSSIIQLVSWGGNYIRTSKPEALHLWMRDLVEGTTRRLLLRRFTTLYPRLNFLYKFALPGSNGTVVLYSVTSGYPL